MKIYEDNTDDFTVEWLDYLNSLTCAVGAVGENRVRTSADSKGRIVRIEIWYPSSESDYEGTVYGYHDLHLPGWMQT